jgi:uncharacterized protein YkwD
MSRYNLFPPSYARSGVCRRLLILCALSSIFIAACAAQVLGQTRSARPVARLISSSEQVVPVPAQTRTWSAPTTTAVAANASGERRAHAALAMTASSLERHAFELINAERAKNGEAPLVWDAELCRMAELHSQHMAEQNFFGHVGPDGMNMEHRARSMGLDGWRVLGENIAYNRGFDDPAAFAVQRWMNSDGHRANILNAKFNRSGVGVVRTAEGRVYLTQVFLAR